MKFIALSILLTSLVSASESKIAVYVPPKETLFVKLDLIPLDEGRMHELSSSLVQLVLSNPDRTPEKLRACAKLIAIAKQFDPSNKQSEKANTALLINEPDSEKGSSFTDDASLALILHFLGNAQQGSEAKQLAQRLKNTLHTLYPNNPHYRSTEPVTHSWDSVVAPLADFSVNPEKDLIETARVDHSEQATGGLFSPSPVKEDFIEKLDKEVKIQKLAQWKKTKLTLSMPCTLRVDSESQKESYDSVDKVTVYIEPKDDGSSDKIRIDYDKFKALSSDRTKLVSKLSEILTANWPDGFQSAKLGAELSKPLSKSTDLGIVAATAAIALDASLLEKNLSEDLVVACGINSSGAFTRNTRFWEYLPQLSRLEDDHRILVTNDTEGDLRQLLVTTDSEFFIRHEILAVKNLKDSRNYRGEKLAGDIAKASELFATVQEALQGKSIRSMAKNSHVRSKLQEVYSLNPQHLSAKMLLILGSNVKPNSIETKYLGYEVRRMLKQADHLLSSNKDSTDHANNIIAMGESIDEEIEGLSRHAAAEDREILRELEDFATKLQSAGKSRLKSSDYYSNNASFHAKSYSNNMRELKTMENELSVKAAQLIASN